MVRDSLLATTSNLPQNYPAFVTSICMCLFIASITNNPCGLTMRCIPHPHTYTHIWWTIPTHPLWCDSCHPPPHQLKTSPQNSTHPPFMLCDVRPISTQSIDRFNMLFERAACGFVDQRKWEIVSGGLLPPCLTILSNICIETIVTEGGEGHCTL